MEKGKQNSRRGYLIEKDLLPKEMKIKKKGRNVLLYGIGCAAYIFGRLAFGENFYETESAIVRLADLASTLSGPLSLVGGSIIYKGANDAINSLKEEISKLEKKL